MEQESFKILYLLMATIAVSISVLYVWFITKRHLYSFSSVTTKLAPILVATIAALTTFMISFLGTIDERSNDIVGDQIVIEKNNYENKIEGLEHKLLALEDNMRNLSRLTESVDSVPNIESISKYESRLSTTEEKISDFEGLLITEAEKLVTLPLIKQELVSIKNELDSLKSLNESQTKFFQESINQSRWILGTLGLGMLALIFPIARSSLSNGKNENEGPSPNKKSQSDA